VVADPALLGQEPAHQHDSGMSLSIGIFFTLMITRLAFTAAAAMALADALICSLRGGQFYYGEEPGLIRVLRFRCR
jgi:hypothetical protein